MLTDLKRAGICVVMGPRAGLYLPEAGVDYRSLEVKYLPYHPNFDDINKASKEPNELVVIPLQPYSPNLFEVLRLTADRMRRRSRRMRDSNSFYEGPEGRNTPRPVSIHDHNPRFEWSLKPYKTHLKIGAQPASYLKKSFDEVIASLRDLPVDRIPVVIECHTKSLPNHYRDIEEFLRYVCTKYSDEVEFGDLTNYNAEIQSRLRQGMVYAN